MGDRRKAAAFLRQKGHMEAARHLEEVFYVLDDMRGYLRASGYKGPLLKNYFPRQIIDASQFKTIPEVQNYLQYLAKKKGVTSFSDAESEILLTNAVNEAMLKGQDNLSFGRTSSNLKLRQLFKFDDARLDAYADPMYAFDDYVENTVRQVERQKFFNEAGAKVNIGANAENIETAAKLIAKDLQKGDMSL